MNERAHISLSVETDHKNGPWMQLYHGGRYHFLTDNVDDVCIEDIIRSLAFQSRFNGHCSSFYSVAQHSVICSWVAEEESLELARIMLLHEVEEALFGDITRPLKYLMPDQMLEHMERVRGKIMRKFGLPEIVPQRGNEIDNLVLACEKRDLLPFSESWTGLPEPDPLIVINPLSPNEALHSMRSRFRTLFPEFELV